MCFVSVIPQPLPENASLESQVPQLKRIEPNECQLNLLAHVEDMQFKIESALDKALEHVDGKSFMLFFELWYERFKHEVSGDRIVYSTLRLSSLNVCTLFQNWRTNSTDLKSARRNNACCGTSWKKLACPARYLRRNEAVKRCEEIWALSLLESALNLVLLNRMLLPL